MLPERSRCHAGLPSAPTATTRIPKGARFTVAVTKPPEGVRSTVAPSTVESYRTAQVAAEAVPKPTIAAPRRHVMRDRTVLLLRRQPAGAHRKTGSDGP